MACTVLLERQLFPDPVQLPRTRDTFHEAVVPAAVLVQLHCAEGDFAVLKTGSPRGWARKKTPRSGTSWL